MNKMRHGYLKKNYTISFLLIILISLLSLSIKPKTVLIPLNIILQIYILYYMFRGSSRNLFIWGAIPMFCIYCFVNILIMLFQLAIMRFRFPIWYLSEENFIGAIQSTVFMYSTGLSGAFLGYLLYTKTKHHNLTNNRENISITSKSIERLQLFKKKAPSLIVGFLVLFVLMGYGFMMLWKDRVNIDTRHGFWTVRSGLEGTSWYYILASLIAPVVILGYSIVLSYRGSKENKVRKVIIAALFASLSSAFFVLSARRFNILIPIISCIGIFELLNKKLSYSLWFLFGVLGLTVVLPLGILREIDYRDLNLNTIRSKLVSDAIVWHLTTSIVRFEIDMSVKDAIDNGYRVEYPGSTYVNGSLFFLPQRIRGYDLEGGTYHISNIIRGSLYNATDLPCSVFAEAYMNGGLIGVFLILGFVTYFLAYFDYKASISRKPWVLFTWAYVGPMVFVFCSIPWDCIVPNLVFFIFVPVFVLAASSRIAWRR